MLYRLILLFTMYSFSGWVCETIYCSVPAGKFINRGFLSGPVCPVYGFGGLLVVFLLTPFQNNIVLLFISGALATSALEYLTAFILEKLFHTKWWDYSGRFLNIHGRVCLLNSVLFGLLSVFVMLFIHPFYISLIDRLPQWLAVLLSAVLLLYFSADTFFTVRAILRLNNRLEKLHERAEELERRRREYNEKLRDKLVKLDAEHKKALRRNLRRLAASFEEAHRNSPLSQKRLLKAFPNMQSLRHRDALNRLKTAIEKRKKK